MAVELPERCVALLRMQRGVIARRQAEDAGVSPVLMRDLIRRGRWRQLYWGVYATFTGDPSRAAWHWAAVLRTGEGAALSHYTAAEIDGLTDRVSSAIHVTIGHDRKVRPDGQRGTPGVPRIVVHRSRGIATSRHPARTPPRTRVADTVIDLTQLATSFDEVLGWLCRGCERGLTTAERLRAAAACRTRMAWRREILAALDDVAAGTHSPLEYRYVHGVERPHGLPDGRRQAEILTESGKRRLDNLYAAFSVGVELDGRAYHPAEARWDDLHRDNSCAAAGLLILRYCWADVTIRRCATAAEVGSVLRLRGWTGQLRRCSPTCTARLS
jgi:predicted transcriptional regulator of viral defense system